MKPRRFIRLFQSRFVPAVFIGRKTRTVRKRPKRMPRVGDVIECRYWSGKPYRSKQVKIAEGRITRVEAVRIEEGRIDCPDIWQGTWLSVPEMEAFAQADGFESATELCRWFKNQHGLPFEGIMIEWEPDRTGKEAHG